MGSYAIKRVLQAVPTLFVVSVLIFMMMRIMPGDLVSIIMEGQSVFTTKDIAALSGDRSKLYTEAAQRIREEYHLEKPLIEQYWVWITGALRGDFGKSPFSHKPTIELLRKAIPVSLQIGFMAFLISLLVSFPLGIIAAVRQDKPIDYIARVTAIFAYSVPSFFTGILVLLVLSLYFQYSPPIMFHSLLKDPAKNLEQTIFPAIVLGIVLAGSQSRMIRNTLLEVMRQDYIRTAWSKGLSEKTIIARHALKNAMIPVVTLMGVQMAHLITGSVIIETIFAVPGVGMLTVNALQNRDYPQIETNVMFIALVIVTFNLAVDLLYGLLDPRIRYVKN